MFYDAFLELCNEVGKSPTAIGELLGISKGTGTIQAFQQVPPPF